ncbi:helix-turn-helix domain-containing protein [Dapis sp. BLCC M126]
MVEKTYKFRFYPTPEQKNLLRRTLGCLCWRKLPYL